MEEDGGDGVQLFDGVVFTIMPADDIDEAAADALIHALNAEGADYEALSQSGSINKLQELTHIISTHVNFMEYEEAIVANVCVVKPSWVTSSIAKKKVASARQHSPDPNQYFHDVVVTCGSLPEGDQEAIIAGVIALGGQHSSPLSKLVTHIVTNDLEHPKCQKALTMIAPAKIVLPHWFDDCFKLGRKIKERPYAFPDPELFREDAPKVRDSNSGLLDGAIEPRPNSPPPSPSPPSSPTKCRKELAVLQNRNILLSSDLELSSHMYKTLRGLIEHSGAELVDDVDKADIFICAYRDGEDYKQASLAGKTVANLSWLYYVLNRNKWSSPQRKLMHYPIPRDGLPGFEGMCISVSNYTGDARPYMENLIRVCGAEYTKTMKQDNTHLITAHMQSEKCDAAQEWGVNIVNHIWLEESYAKCGPQPLTNPRYTTFPARTNLGEVAGQTSLDMTKVEQMFFAKPKGTPRKAAPFVKNVASASKVVPVVTNDATPCQAVDDTTGPSTAKRPRGRPRKSLATPRFQDDEKENESPLLTSTGRASKSKAMNMLTQQADDIALYQKEMKRKGGVTHGRSRGSIDNVHEQSSPIPTEEPKQRKKRKSDESNYDATAIGSDLSDGETQRANAKGSKKAKHKHTDPSGLPRVSARMIVTGDDRWTGNKNKTREDVDRRSMRKLGILITTESKDVQILVAPQIRRTRKFVTAIASAPLVVDTSYLDFALQNGELPDPPPLLKDTEHEAHYGFTLSESLTRAKINNHRLFHGWTIYITKAVTGGIETYQEIVAVNGGTALPFAGRNGVSIAKRARVDDKKPSPEWQHQGGKEELDYSYLVSGDSAAEKNLWRVFREMCETKGLKARVVRHDWLLDAAMRQEVVWDEKFAH